MDAKTYPLSQKQTDLEQLIREDLLRVEKLIAEEHRRLAALAGQMEHYGLPDIAEKLSGALWGVTAASLAVTLQIQASSPPVGSRAYLGDVEPDDHSTPA